MSPYFPLALGFRFPFPSGEEESAMPLALVEFKAAVVHSTIRVRTVHSPTSVHPSRKPLWPRAATPLTSSPIPPFHLGLGHVKGASRSL